MARARNIKPGFFKNEDLAECSPWARLCFAGLWTLADREGRLEDRAKRIKGELFAFDSVEVEPMLCELAKHGFIARYAANGRGLIQIAAFLKHQNPHHREPASDFPSPESLGLIADGTEPKPQADASLNQPKALGKAEAFDPRSDLARGSSRAESGALIPESGKKERALRPLGSNPVAPARALSSDPPEAEGHKPTPAGLVCRAMRQAGIAAVNPGDPRLLTLIAQGATAEEFEGLAAEAAGKGKGFGWVLAAVQGRRAEAAAISLAPAPPPPDWRANRSSVIQRGCELGLEEFDQVNGHWPAYRAKVIAAHDETQAES